MIDDCVGIDFNRDIRGGRPIWATFRSLLGTILEMPCPTPSGCNNSVALDVTNRGLRGEKITQIAMFFSRCSRKLADSRTIES